jgi:hypothetical protein
LLIPFLDACKEKKQLLVDSFIGTNHISTSLRVQNFPNQTRNLIPYLIVGGEFGFERSQTIDQKKE